MRRHLPVAVVAVLILISGWLSDVLYAALDPRIRV